MPDIPDEEFDFIFEQLVILENNKKKILFKDFQEMIWRVRKIGAEGIIREEIERSKIERSIQAQWEKVEERLQAVEERLQAVEEQWEILQQMREAQASIKEARRLKGQSRPPKGARPVPPPPAEPEEEPLDAGFVCTDITYPHEGKHCPPTGVEGNMNLLKEKTKGDEPSLFITRASFEVRRWDYIAMQHGLTVDNGSTKIFNFDFWIGASDNEESQWMRLDGDHSHPITEAAFDDIIIREIERAVTNKASDRIQEICNWLTKRKIDFKYYLRKSKCPHDLIPHES